MLIYSESTARGVNFRLSLVTYFNTLKSSHYASHPGRAGSCKQSLNHQATYMKVRSLHADTIPINQLNFLATTSFRDMLQYI